MYASHVVSALVIMYALPDNWQILRVRQWNLLYHLGCTGLQIIKVRWSHCASCHTICRRLVVCDEAEVINAH